MNDQSEIDAHCQKLELDYRDMVSQREYAENSVKLKNTDANVKKLKDITEKADALFEQKQSGDCQYYGGERRSKSKKSKSIKSKSKKSKSKKSKSKKSKSKKSRSKK
jgi:hypothetical protein